MTDMGAGAPPGTPPDTKMSDAEFLRLVQAVLAFIDPPPSQLTRHAREAYDAGRS